MVLRKIFPTQAIENNLDVCFIGLGLQLSKKALNNSEEIQANLIFKIRSTTLQFIQIMGYFIFVGS